MSDPSAPGGSRRIDRILAPDFGVGLSEMEMEEVRTRRDLCRAEREYLSFLRRLLQGRRDILRDESERRRSGADAGSLVERISAVLSEGARGPSRGEAVMVSVPDEEITLARRRVERLLSDVRLSDLAGLSDDELEETIGRIEEEERTISESRGSVMEVHDRFQEELKRRYRTQLKDLRA